MAPGTGRAAGPGVERDLPGVRATLPLLLYFCLEHCILHPFAPAGHMTGVAQQFYPADGQGLPMLGKAGFADTLKM